MLRLFWVIRGLLLHPIHSPDKKNLYQFWLLLLLVLVVDIVFIGYCMLLLDVHEVHDGAIQQRPQRNPGQGKGHLRQHG